MKILSVIATFLSLLIFSSFASAQTSSLFVNDGGKVGVGTETPDSFLHVIGTDAESNGNFHIENTNGTTRPRELGLFENNGDVTFAMLNNAPGAATPKWAFAHLGGDFRIITPTTSGIEFRLTNTGDLHVLGNFVSGGQTLNVPDYVFEDDYELIPLEQLKNYIEENKHLPEVPSSSDIAENGLNVGEMQMALLKKIEELTLYTLDQEKRISEQEETIRNQIKVNEELMQRIEAISHRLDQMESS